MESSGPIAAMCPIASRKSTLKKGLLIVLKRGFSAIESRASIDCGYTFEKSLQTDGGKRSSC